MDELVMTPSQTIGPLYGFALVQPGLDEAVPPDSQGAFALVGAVLDGDARPITWPEIMVEVWNGSQFARTQTDASGQYRVVVEKPAPEPSPDGGTLAPHLHVAVFGRGLLKHLLTRVYFPDEAELNAQDPVLMLVPAHRRGSLIAADEGERLRFDIRIQGDGETVFFEV